GHRHLVACAGGLEDRARELRMIAQHAVEVAAVEDEEIRSLPAADRRRAGRGEDERRLAEEAAGAERGEHAPVAVEDLDLAADEEVHLVADVALADHEVAGVDDLR